MDIAFKYDNNIEILWNGDVDFTIQQDGKVMQSFKDVNVKNKEQAEASADAQLAEILEEEKLSYKKRSDAAKLAQQQRIQNQRTAVQMERINASKKR